MTFTDWQMKRVCLRFCLIDRLNKFTSPKKQIKLIEVVSDIYKGIKL